MAAHTHAYKCQITTANVRRLPPHTNMHFHHSEEADGQLVVKTELALKDNTLFCLSAHTPSPSSVHLHALPSILIILSTFYLRYVCMCMHYFTLSAPARTYKEAVSPEVSGLTPLTSDSL